MNNHKILTNLVFKQGYGLDTFWLEFILNF